MLLAAEERELPVEDRRVYDLLVYRDHPLRRDRLAINIYRASTDQLPDEERLAARVTHLREILQWCDQVAAPEGLSDEELNQDSLWRKFQAARAVARKILGDRDDPQGGDRTVSVVDPDARTGKHGVFFVGYKLDILMDADSEII